MSENGQPDKVFGASKPRSFEVAGVVFHIRPVRPEAYAAKLAWADEQPQDSLESLWAIRDERILLSIVPDEHDAWRELRAREDSPVELADMDAILDWLTEVHTGRPPQRATASSGGAGSAAASSRAGSSSREVARPR